MTHPVLEEPEIVPRRGVTGIDGHHALVGVDGRLPARGVVVPLGGAGEPGLRRVGGRDERAHPPGAQRLSRLLLEIAHLQVEQGLAGPRVETPPVLLHHHAVLLDVEAELGERLGGVGSEPARALQGLPDLAHRRPALEERGRRPRRHQLAEAVPRALLPEQSQPPELGEPLRREPQETGQLSQREDALGWGQALTSEHSRKATRSAHPPWMRPAIR